MTEEEAKTKWCPFARVLDWGAAAEGFAAPNRWHDGMHTGKIANCIGSACMAWRLEYRVQTIGDKTTSVLIGGFCGLAGKP